MNIVRRRAGVTIIELVVVLLIISIITAAAIPRFVDSLQRFRVESAAERIKADLNMARRRAVITGKQVAVVFDTGTHAYSIPQVSSLNSASRPCQVNLSEAPLYAALTIVSFPGGSGGDLQLVFDHYGAPDSGGSVAVVRTRRCRTRS